MLCFTRIQPPLFTQNSRIIMAQNSLPLPRYISVQSSEKITPHLQRVYFSSEDFSDFPKNQNGAHIKLFFPEQPELKPILPSRNEQGKVVWPNGDKPITRTYTIRHFLENEQLLVVDFVRHTEFGIAANWAKQAQRGQILGLAGPGGRPRFNPEANYWVFIGDLSALPMIAASLELLPEHAQGEVWIEIEAENDRIELIHPKAVNVNWLINQTNIETQIEDAIQRFNWLDSNISVSLAGENTRVVSLRHLFRNKFGVNKANMYAVPYWKVGQTEEGYHQERHQVMDEE